MSNYLGNFSEHPYYSVPMVCDACDVSWGGCQAASHCPRCRMPVDFDTGKTMTREQYERAMAEFDRASSVACREAGEATQ